MQDTPENDAPDGGAAARSLRRLMRLVTVLTVVMIVGMVAVVGLMALKLGSVGGAPVLPEAIHLPDGAKARTVTAGEGWVLVLTDQNEVLVFDAAGTLRQRVPIGK